jgi:hypothetical protein
MHGPNGNHVTNNMTWEEYAKWQRWDEWSERSDDPPLTVETSFWYNSHEFMVTNLNGEYAIVKQPDFETVISNSNFIELLNMDFMDGKSFKVLLPELLFED